MTVAPFAFWLPPAVAAAAGSPVAATLPRRAA
jgi:hypothetical protein